MTQNRSAGTVTSKVRSLGAGAGREVGLVDGDPVDLEASVGRAAAHAVARQPDDPLDVVGGLALAERGSATASTSVCDEAPLGAPGGERLGRVEDDDVAAVEVGRRGRAG